MSNFFQNILSTGRELVIWSQENMVKFSKINKYVKWAIITVSSLLIIWLVGSLVLLSISPSKLFDEQDSYGRQPNFSYQQYWARDSKDEQISLWYKDNMRSKDVVLYLHGNAGRVYDIINDLSTNYDVLSPAAPGFDESEGDASVDTFYEAGEVAYQWLLNKGYTEKQIIIYGHSMGGSSAVHLASIKPNAQKLVVVNTFSSVQSMCFRDYSIFCVFSGGIMNSSKYAEDVKIKTRVFSLPTDKKVPYEEGKKLYEHFTSASDKKFTDLKGDTHSYFDVKQTLE